MLFRFYARCNEPSYKMPALVSPHKCHSEQGWLLEMQYTEFGWPFATSEPFSVLLTQDM